MEIEIGLDLDDIGEIRLGDQVEESSLDLGENQSFSLNRDMSMVSASGASSSVSQPISQSNNV